MKHQRKPCYLYSLLALFILPTFVFSYFILDQVTPFKVIVFGLVCMVIGAVWDVWATKHGWRDRFWLWTFNEKYMLGPKLFGIPIEEYGFFFFGSAFSVTLWELLNNLQRSPTAKSLTIISVIFLWTFAALIIPRIKGAN